MKLSIGLDRRAAAAWVFHWDGNSYYSIAACADPGCDGGPLEANRLPACMRVGVAVHSTKYDLGSSTTVPVRMKQPGACLW